MDSLSQFLESLTGIIVFFSNAYDKFVLMGNFNGHHHDNAMKDSIKVDGLINLTKGNTYFKGQGFCPDLILTNRSFSFKLSNSYETGIGNYHHLIYSMLNSNLYNS